DYGDCAGDIEGRSAPRRRARPGADGDRHRRQRACLDGSARRRAPGRTGRISMSEPSANLPIVFHEVSLTAGEVTILDRVTLGLAPGAPTVLIGPNGAGKTTLLRVAMGLATPSRGHVTWAGQANPLPTGRAIVFQRPGMLRRSAGANIRYALRAAGVARLRRRA